MPDNDIPSVVDVCYTIKLGLSPISRELVVAQLLSDEDEELAVAMGSTLNEVAVRAVLAVMDEESKALY